MTIRRVLSFGVSTLAVASWFSAASTPDVPPPAAPVAPSAPSALDRSSATLQVEIARLHDRPEPPAPPQEAPPAFRLIGVAEDETADGVVRTAILSGLGDVFLVKAGDTVGGRFRVDQVSADAVQLTSLSTSAASTLALR